MDRTCAIALTLHEDMFCPDCGVVKAEAWDPKADMDGWYEARSLICPGCEARQRHAAGQKEPVPGEKVYLVNTKPKD